MDGWLRRIACECISRPTRVGDPRRWLCSGWKASYHPTEDLPACTIEPIDLGGIQVDEFLHDERTRPIPGFAGILADSLMSIRPAARWIFQTPFTPRICGDPCSDLYERFQQHCRRRRDRMLRECHRHQPLVRSAADCVQWDEKPALEFFVERLEMQQIIETAWPLRNRNAHGSRKLFGQWCKSPATAPAVQHAAIRCVDGDHGLPTPRAPRKLDGKAV